MRLTSFRSVDLDHRAFFLRGAPRQSLYLVGDEDGNISVFDSTLTVRKLRAPFSKLRAVALHPSEPILAAVDDESGNLSVMDFDGSLLLKESAPPPFQDCFFDASGDYLWCAAVLTQSAVEIQLRRTDDYSIVSSVEVEDPYYDSSCLFFFVPQPSSVALWLAAGQDGQQIYWLSHTHDVVTCEKEPYLEDSTPPVFSPRGDAFLVVEEESLLRYSYPVVHPLGTCYSPYEDEEMFGDWHCYLDDTRALVSAAEGRLFLLDVENMTIQEEVIVENHEPRPAEQLYPNLVGDKQLCTDISHIERIGDVLLFVYRRDGGTGLDGWRDTILYALVQTVLDQLKS